MATDLAENDTKLREAFNFDEPLKILYARLNECVEYPTTANDSVTEGQIVCIAYGLIVETGQFQEYYRTWHAKLNPKKTLTKLQARFIKDQTDLHK